LTGGVCQNRRRTLTLSTEAQPHVDSDATLEYRGRPSGPTPSAKLDLEARLERWICQDLSLVGEDLLLLGSQVATAYGQAIDILALDRQERRV
jgi:RecB family endonuclease NucS